MKRPNPKNHGVIVDETTTFTVTEICQKCNLPYEFFVQIIEHGIIESKAPLNENNQLDLITIKRIETAFHLYRDLEINIPGVALILELKDEIAKLTAEIELLNKHLT